jgi:hypothetical protein
MASAQITILPINTQLTINPKSQTQSHRALPLPSPIPTKSKPANHKPKQYPNSQSTQPSANITTPLPSQITITKFKQHGKTRNCRKTKEEEIVKGAAG